MVDIIQMKQRVAATQEKIKAANELGEQQSKRLLDLLRAVETNLLSKQEEIDTLRAQQATDKDEIEQLRSLLQASLDLAEDSGQSRPSLPNREMDTLFRRLDEIVASANRDLGHSYGPLAAPVVDPPEPGVKAKKKARGRGLKKIFS